MNSFIFIIACLVIGAASYWVTKRGIEGIFGKRLKVSITNADGVKSSTTVRYHDGDDIDVILKDIRDQ
jgi:hypothetical protein